MPQLSTSPLWKLIHTLKLHQFSSSKKLVTFSVIICKQFSWPKTRTNDCFHVSSHLCSAPCTPGTSVRSGVPIPRCIWRRFVRQAWHDSAAWWGSFWWCKRPVVPGWSAAGCPALRAGRQTELLLHLHTKPSVTSQHQLDSQIINSSSFASFRIL